jgi:hypothetical protein
MECSILASARVEVQDNSGRRDPAADLHHRSERPRKGGTNLEDFTHWLAECPKFPLIGAFRAAHASVSAGSYSE